MRYPTRTTASVRRRKLPAPQVVWLVIGMALFRDRSIQEVVSHLGLVLSGQKGSRGSNSKTIAPSAIPQQRGKVGDAPIRLIFEQTAEAWAVPAAEADQLRWRGLALYGMDGTTLRIPDTDENREEFHLPGTGRAQSGYPQVRLVALMALRSHLMSGAAFGPCRGKKTGEHTLAQELWPQVSAQSLVIVDRGRLDYGVFYRLSHDADGQITGRKHWLVRGKKNLRWKTIRVFGQDRQRLRDSQVTPHFPRLRGSICHGQHWQTRCHCAFPEACSQPTAYRGRIWRYQCPRAMVRTQTPATRFRISWRSCSLACYPIGLRPPAA